MALMDAGLFVPSEYSGKICLYPQCQKRINIALVLPSDLACYMLQREILALEEFAQRCMCYAQLGQSGACTALLSKDKRH